MTRSIILVLLFCFVSGITAAKPRTSYARAVMDIFSKSNNYSAPTSSVCIHYPYDYYTLPPAVPEETFNLQNATGVDLCDNLTDSDFIVREPSTVLLLRTSTNCSIRQNIQPIQDNNASGIIVITETLYAVNQSYGWKILGLLGMNTTEIIGSLTEESIKVKFTGDSRFDSSLIVLWTAAVFCVAVGAYTGPYRLFKKSARNNEHQILESSTSTRTTDDSNVVGFTVPIILAIVVFISTTLMLLYFFYAYLVYFFIGVFCIATARALHLLTMQIVDSCCPTFNLPIWRDYGLIQIVVALLSVSTVIIWLIFRHESWSWTLQDIMGMCFCIHLIQLLQLPNLKVITILLSLLFIYDVFFCFITPFMTKNGESVMVAVATGGDSESKESLPMLLKCPRLQSNVMRICHGNPFSMLGFGDIIVPGFLVSFAHSFDLRIGVKYPVYLITSVVAYAIGLSGAFVALLLSSTGQPALLYIVPMLLANIYIVGLWRKEVKDLWRGSPELELELQAHA